LLKRNTFNSEILQEINKQRFRGASPEDLKKLYMRHNCFDVNVDCPVYRIFELPYQLLDIKYSRFSLVNPSKYKDRYENPLLDKEFIDETGTPLTLNGVVGNSYVSSWTYKCEEEPFNWVNYTRDCLGIRIKSTVGKVMEEMLNLDNPFYELQFHAGLVDYYQQEDIDNWLKGSHYTDFLDTLGQKSVASLMAIRNKFSDEKEVRFVFSNTLSNKDNLFVNGYVTIYDGVLKHPMSWLSVIDEVVLDPRIHDAEFDDTEKLLRTYGLTCAIKHSSCR
jgi:hypothetical protein